MDQTEKHCILHPSQRTCCVLGASLGSGHMVAGRQAPVSDGVEQGTDTRNTRW